MSPNKVVNFMSPNKVVNLTLLHLYSIFKIPYGGYLHDRR